METIQNTNILEELADELLILDTEIREKTERVKAIKATLVETMQGNNMHSITGSKSVAKLVPGVRKTIIDTTGFLELVPREVFLDCVSVGVTAARKLAGNDVIKQCSTIKQGNDYIKIISKE